MTDTFIGPSSKVFVIREQNGADDDTLSRMGVGKGREIEIMNGFLAGVVESIDGNSPVTPKDILDLGLRDKYAILIQSRIFSLGSDVKFNYAWKEDRPPAEYSEDLTKFIWDYSKPFPDNSSPDYHPQKLIPYPAEGTIEISIKDRMYTLDFLNGHGELILFADKAQSINTELIARNLSIKGADGVYNKVQNFAQVSSRDLSIIRSTAEKLDPIPMADVSIEDPTSGETITVPLLSIRDFFFPTLL